MCCFDMVAESQQPQGTAETFARRQSPSHNAMIFPHSTLFTTPNRTARIRLNDEDSRASLIESKLARIAADAAFRQAVRTGGSNLERLMPRLTPSERQWIARLAADRSLDLPYD